MPYGNAAAVNSMSRVRAKKLPIDA